MKWHEASGTNIRPVEVTKETGSFVVIRGRRCAKSSDGIWYRPTFEEARETLLEEKQRKLEGLLRGVREIQKAIDKIRSLKDE